MTEQRPTTWFPHDLPLAEASRRAFLRSTVAVGALAAALGANSAGTRAQTPEKELASYTKTFFTDVEWAFILAVCARLIPSEGDGPGALEAHVPIFIDRQLSDEFGKAADWYMQGPHVPDADPALGFQSPLPPAEIYRGGIAIVDEWCRTQKGKAFFELDAATQDDVLKSVAANKVGIPPPLRDFFGLLLQNAKEGYFADPLYGGNHKMAAWSYIGFPGARGNFREWVGRHNVPYPLGPVSIRGERA